MFLKNYCWQNEKSCKRVRHEVLVKGNVNAISFLKLQLSSVKSECFYDNRVVKSYTYCAFQLGVKGVLPFEARRLKSEARTKSNQSNMTLIMVDKQPQRSLI